jgi:very-short-patch-repair endonuclease
MRTRYRRSLVHGTLLRHCRAMRADATDAERKLWSRLRRRQLGARFKRQYPIDGFIADFCSPQIRLVIEVDGGQHAERTAYDAERSFRLARNGYRVLRFWNNDVLRNIDRVMETIVEAIQTPTPSRG